MFLHAIYPIVAALNIFWGLHAAPRQVASKIPFESTITYQLLQYDTVLYGNNNEEKLIFKDLMQTACKRIQAKYPSQKIATADGNMATEILSTIDSTFTDFKFLYLDNDGTDIQFDFLTATLRTDIHVRKYIMWDNQTNIYRAHYWQKNPDLSCRLIDCDLYSEVYLGIGQMLGLPLSIVQLPGHFYIRWNFNSESYLPWDVTKGVAYDNEQNIANYARLTSYNKDSYFFNFSLNDVKAYYYALRAKQLTATGDFKNLNQAKTDYEQSLKLRANLPATYSSYVWLLIKNPALDKYIDYQKLHNYIDIALTKEPNTLYYDAKACLYALSKDFKNAIATEQLALNCENDPLHWHSQAAARLESFKAGKFLRTGDN